MSLPEPRLYLPFADGRYTVTARLKQLGTEPHFQVDARYREYVEAKAANHARARSSYHVEDAPDPALKRAMLDFALATLPQDQPAAFAGTADTLTNHLLGLTLRFDREALRVVEGPAPYLGLDALEAIALQTQEDWALLAKDPATGADRTVVLHVSFPSHWRPTDKIGRSFIEVHKPVAGVEPLLKAAPSLVDVMIHKGPWERFTWTLPRTPHLDEHLDVLAPVSIPEDVGRGCWLRVERQVTHGFPEQDGALFMIRLHILPLHEVVTDPANAAALASAIRSKTPASLAYKSLDDWHEPLLAYLDAAATRG